MGVAEGVMGGVLGCFGRGLVIWAESGVMVLFVLLVSERENCGIATRSPLSTFSADLMGVAHFLRERRLRVDWPELGGVGVDCTELVLAESGFTGSDILGCLCRVPWLASHQTGWRLLEGRGWALREGSLEENPSSKHQDCLPFLSSLEKTRKMTNKKRGGGSKMACNG